MKRGSIVYHSRKLLVRPYEMRWIFHDVVPVLAGSWHHPGISRFYLTTGTISLFNTVSKGSPGCHHGCNPVQHSYPGSLNRGLKPRQLEHFVYGIVACKYQNDWIKYIQIKGRPYFPHYISNGICFRHSRAANYEFCVTRLNNEHTLIFTYAIHNCNL